MTGNLIVIDGLDGSGKSTQAQAVYEYLKAKDDKVLLISYPDYSKPSSTLVKMYLNGEFSQNADDINAYAASSFYAVDRYASFKQHWQRYYDAGYTIIASRYVSSNAIHQMVKLDQSEWDNFLMWLSDYEYNKLALPKPNKVIFLDMTRNVADKLIMSRYDGDATKKDIHESNMAYLEKCQITAKYSANIQGWDIISCCDGKTPYPIEKITQEILNLL
ncbi:MAG: thymidylate kinase [Oscillospiraceae bacterium]